MPLLATDLEAFPAPLPMMASGGERGKHPQGGGHSHDGHQPPSHRARMDVATGSTSLLTTWGFTLCCWLVGPSCHGSDPCLLTSVGLLL
jgi:hypothetical protein